MSHQFGTGGSTCDSFTLDGKTFLYFGSQGWGWGGGCKGWRDRVWMGWVGLPKFGEKEINAPY